ncbi:hypothetical protein QJS66_14295 [Kocuria rhizophila]|nr:hypothetical protein QJS66_14295 [Kocuria rhizophila]
MSAPKRSPPDAVHELGADGRRRRPAVLHLGGVQPSRCWRPREPASTTGLRLALRRVDRGGVPRGRSDDDAPRTASSPGPRRGGGRLGGAAHADVHGAGEDAGLVADRFEAFPGVTAFAEVDYTSEGCGRRQIHPRASAVAPHGDDDAAPRVPGAWTAPRAPPGTTRTRGVSGRPPLRSADRRGTREWVAQLGSSVDWD